MPITDLSVNLSELLTILVSYTDQLFVSCIVKTAYHMCK